MLKLKRLLLIWMAILLMMPFQGGAAHAADAPGGSSSGGQGGGGTAAFVKIKNKWQSNYLYEDAAGVIRYGITSLTDQTAHWVIEDVPGNSSYKRIKNRSTGHYIVMGSSVARKDALRGASVTASTAADQWQFRNGTSESFITIRSVTDLTQDFFIHEEDQLGFAQVSSDINAAFDSPQWQLAPVSDELPVRISNPFRDGQYLYEDKDGVVKFARLPMEDQTTYWIVEQVQDSDNGAKIVRLRNQKSGHYITQGTLWAPINSLPFVNTTKNEWIMAAGTSDGLLTFTNVYAKGTDRIPGDTDEIDGGSQIYVLNTQFDDNSARSNNWSVLDRFNAQWRIEIVTELKPARIANYTTEQVSDKYLYEDQGIVKYGSITPGSVTSAVYQWVVEDFNGKKRIRNLGSGHYMAEPNAAQPASPLQSIALGNSLSAGQWSIAASKQYDDYVTVQSAVYAGTYMHVSDQLGFAQSSLVSPEADAAQWLFEDPSVIAGVEQYIQITNAWNSLSLFEDQDSNLKYGNVKEDDQRAQWVIEKFAGRKRIKNRATGHYINSENPVDGHLRVTPVDDTWKSAVWVIETINGSTKQIHSVNDTNEDPNHQKYVNVQNLIKYAEYSEIPASWQSKNWRFVPVTAEAPKPQRFRNKATNLYLYEDADHTLRYGDKPASDLSSLWFLNTSENNALYKYLINAQSGYGVTLENVVPNIAQDSPPDHLITYPTISSGWESANWMIENASVPGYVALKSGWTKAHYIYADVSAQDFKVSKLKGNDDSALFAMEAVTLPPQLPTGQKRIKNVDNGQYLYENSRGIVMYGSPASNDGYSYWTIESDGGVQRFKNAATGHYITMNAAYEYVSSSDAGHDNQASQWVIEDIAGAGKFWIRSNNAPFNDEYLNVVNSVGYPERGLYSRNSGGNEKKLQWTFEDVVLPFAVPDLTEKRNTDTGTPIINDLAYIQIINKSTQEAILEQDGQVSTSILGEDQPSAQWLLQDYNGHKLIKNRATGHLLQSLGGAGGVLSSSADVQRPASQWIVDEVLGYKQIRNAVDAHLLYSDASVIKQGEIDSKQAAAQWTFEPVRGDAVYEAESAFVGGGVNVSSDISAFTGTGYIDSFAAPGARAILAVNGQAAASYQAAIRYQNNTAANQTLSLVVNGLTIQQLSLAAGSGWQEQEVTLPLRAGYNSVSFEYQAGDSGHVAIDRVVVHDSVNKPYRGAIEPYTTYEAEHGTTNGKLIGPSRIYRELASEASGRQAVQLEQTGQFVQFQLAKKANSIVLRYSIPDSADGKGIDAKLGLYVNNVKVKDLDLTSKYAWEYGNYPWSNEPGQGSAHRFFDEIHTLIGNVNAGDTIKLQKDSGNNAPSYVIDFIETEQAPETAYAMPNGFLSITDFGAVPNDGLDDSLALKAAITAAKAQHKGVWIPAGVFELANDHGGIADEKKDGEEDTTKLFILDHVTIRGAGMWYTTLKGAKFFANGSHIGVYDLAIDGELNVRKDDAHTNAFEGAFGSGSTVQNVWIEHTKTGMWIARPQLSYGLNSDNYTNEFYVGGLRMRNLMADGINFSTNTKNSMVEQSNVRYAGDDGLAMWSTVIKGAYPDDFTDNNTFRFDTVQLPWLSNNMVVFGGKDNKMTDNVLKDTIGLGGGIVVSTRFSPLTPFRGTTRVERNTLIRTGSRDAGLHSNFGAIWVYADTKAIDSDVLIQDNILLDNTYQGISIQGTSPVSKVTFKNNVIDGAGTNGFETASTITGSVNVDNVIIRHAVIQDVANSAGTNLTITESGSGFASTHPAVPTNSDESGQSSGGGGVAAAPSVIKIDDKKFTDAIAGNQQEITISSGSSLNAVEFEVSAAALLQVSAKLPDAHLIFEHLGITYEVPTNLAKLLTSQQAELLQTTNSTIKVKIEKLTEADMNKIKQQAADQNSLLIGNPIRFEISLVSGNQTISLHQFGHTYVTRTITLDGSVDAATAAAVIYHPETGKFNYVPAEFSVNNGKTLVTIHSTSNSIYAVIQQKRSFDDLQGHWARTEIELLASKLIVNGQTDTRFAPDQSITRAEFSALLVRALGLSASANTQAQFLDVNKGDWYESAVQTAAEHALVSGYEDGSFHPNQTISREEMAVMASRAWKLRPTEGTTPASQTQLAVYNDADSISSWAKEAFAQVVSGGIMQGKTTKSLDPHALATRAESSVILHRLLQSMKLMN